MFYSRFLDLYGRPNRLTLPERNGRANLGQALDMLAGPAYNEKLGASAGRLQAMLNAGKSNHEIVREFYLSAYTRMPDQEELDDIVRTVAARPDRVSALKDFVWAVICSREFAENH